MGCAARGRAGAEAREASERGSELGKTFPSFAFRLLALVRRIDRCPAYHQFDGDQPSSVLATWMVAAAR